MSNPPPRLADWAKHLAALRAAALQAADPAAAVRRHLTLDDAAETGRVLVAGAGKAGVAMARAAVDVLGGRLKAGVMAVPHPPESPLPPITFIEGGHPLPSEGSLAAGRAIAHLLESTTPQDLVLALISGGGSALLELPQPGIGLSDLQATNDQLLRCGATIHEVNTVRGALSRLKRGGLARLAHPARVIGLILSDVIGNPLHLIASGPTVTEPADPAALTLWAILQRYQLQGALPPAVLRILRDPPVQGSAQPEAVDNRLIASNRLAAEAALDVARALGFEARWLGDDWQGEARMVGQRWAETCLSAANSAQPVCLVAGGESTVRLRRRGRGGRNQEAALAAALAIAGRDNVVLSTFATDGVDGPTEAAGAVVTGETVARARALGLDPEAYLTDNDSYPFFAALNDLIFTGPTGTNVNDLLFGLVY